MGEKGGMTTQAQLNEYQDAFNRRDLSAALMLFAEHAVFEMPLLGQRLFGKREIAIGLQRIFEVTESAQIHFARVKESRNLVIAEGRLQAKLHRDAHAVEIPLAVVLEAQKHDIRRLSTYLDARPYRLWTDGTLFASTQASH
ncbi:MAG: nuclear transport factor 2 family protein [Steroidobacteraceae bacterium]|jgi:ketosteroid isomerase-like protein